MKDKNKELIKKMRGKCRESMSTYFYIACDLMTEEELKENGEALKRDIDYYVNSFSEFCKERSIT